MTCKDIIIVNHAKIPAAKNQSGTISKECLNLVVFKLAQETYGIELEHIREVCRLKDLTPIPCTPVFIEGIINYKGEILSIVNLQKFFDLPGESLFKSDHLIILESGPMMFGIIADAICDTACVPRGRIRFTEHALDTIRQPYLKGLTCENVIILDGQKLLSDKKMSIYETGR
ncbi:MAG: chemotaxis protein CheW [Desulfobacterales bacterium]